MTLKPIEDMIFGFFKVVGNDKVSTVAPPSLTQNEVRELTGLIQALLTTKEAEARIAELSYFANGALERIPRGDLQKRIAQLKQEENKS